MAWTLQKGSGAQQTFDYLNLEAPVISRTSQNVDTLTFRHAIASAISAPTFAVDDLLTFRNGSLIVFRGHVKKVSRAGAGPRDSHTYTVVNAWDYFDRFIYHYTWPAGPSLATSYITSRVLMNVFVDDGIATPRNTREQIIALLDFVLARCAAESIAAPFQVGAILTDVLVQPPIQEYTSRTVAELIRDQMRWHRDAVIWWDYGTTPPTINITRREDCDAVELDLSVAVTEAASPSYFCTAWGLESREDLQLGSVVFNYEVTGENDGEPTFSITQDVYPPGSTGQELDSYVATLNFRGPTSSVARAELAVAAIDAAHGSTATDATRIAWWLSHLPAYAASEAAGDLRNIEISDPTFSPALGSNVNELLPESGQIASWMGVTSAKVRITAKLTSKKYSTDDLQLYGQSETISVMVTATNATSQTYTRLTSYEAGEFLPVGLAEQIYAMHATLHWQGRITIVEQECSQRAGLGKVINLANGAAAWATMDALVQTVEEDFAAGTTTLTVGPPGQLGEQDIVELMRVNRVSVRYTAPETLVDGARDDMDLGDTSGLENSQAGAPEKSYFSVYQPDDIVGGTNKTEIRSDAATGTHIVERTIPTTDTGGKILSDAAAKKHVVTDKTSGGAVITADAANAKHEVVKGSAYVKGEVASSAGKLTIYKDADNNIVIDSGACYDMPLSIVQIKGCDPATGTDYYMLVIGSAPSATPIVP